MRRITRFIAATLGVSLAVALASTDARAAYSGFIYRTLCPSASFVTWTDGEAEYWGRNGSSLCGVGIVGIEGQGDYYYATIQIPYESQTSSNQADVWLSVVGMNAGIGIGGQGQMCSESYSYDVLGNLSSSSSNPCTSGTSMTYQWLHTTIYVPSEGSVVTHVAGQSGTRVLQSTIGYISSGT